MNAPTRTRLDQAWQIGAHGKLTITVELDVPMPSNGWTIFSGLIGRADTVAADLGRFIDKPEEATL